MKKQNQNTGTGRGVARHNPINNGESMSDAGDVLALPVSREVGGVLITYDNGEGLADALTVTRARRVAKIGRTVHADARETRGDACALPVAVASRFGCTARDERARAIVTRDTRARNVAHHVATLAGEFARAFRRFWESEGGRPFDAFTVSPADEIEAIYRAAFVRAFVRSGVCPSGKRAMFARSGNQLGFRALRVWFGEVQAASNSVRSYLWGKGAEKSELLLASAFDVRSFARAFADTSRVRFAGVDASGDNEHEQGDALAFDALGNVGSWYTSRHSPVRNRAGAVPVSRLRRELRHARLCLRAFWAVTASRKWRAGYVADCQLLRAVVAVSRGDGVASLGKLGMLSEGGRFCSDALRQAKLRLVRRLRDGDKLLTDKAETCARAFVECFGARASRALVAEVLPSVAKRATVAAPVRDDYATLYGVAGC